MQVSSNDKFDKQDMYERYLKSKVEEISIICRKNNIPFFVSFCVKNNEEGSEYKNELLSAGGINVILADDKLAEHIKITRGYKAVKSLDEYTKLEKSEFELFNEAATTELTPEYKDIVFENISDLEEKTNFYMTEE